MPAKPKIAFYWCAACGGCDEAVVDLAEEILEITKLVDIAFWPCAMDFKRSDVEAMPDKSLLATLLNGSIRTSEQEEMAHLLRRKSQYLVAFGACAHLGGVPSLANQFSREPILRYIYEEAPTLANDSKTQPAQEFHNDGHLLHLPELREGVRSLDQVVQVDFYIPGCPPVPKTTKAAIRVLLSDKLPPAGSVLAPDIALCDECSRKASKPIDLSFTVFQRPHQKLLDPQQCFLAQGIVCMGPATRSGCGAVSAQGNMPCSGCCGPTSRVRDQGAKILSSLCASMSATTERDINKALEGIPDPVGTFYRYGLAKSLLRRKANPAVTPKETV